MRTVINVRMESNLPEGGERVPSKVFPSFDLQRHHSWVSIPTEFDMRDLVRKHLVFPLKIVQIDAQPRLLLAMKDCFNSAAIQEVEFRANMEVIPVVADELDIRWLVHRHVYGRSLTPTPSNRPRLDGEILFESLVRTVHHDLLPN